MVVAPLVEFLRSLHDVHQLVEEPLVNLGEVVNLVYCVACTHSLRDDEDTLVGRFAQCFVDVFDNQLLVFHETVHALTNHTKTFLDGFFEGTSDGHDFTYRFHAGAQFAVYAVELTQVPARNLTYAVVQCRFEEGRSCFSYRVLQVEQSVAQSQLSCNESQRITCSLRCQCRRTAQTGIYLDYAVVF